MNCFFGRKFLFAGFLAFLLTTGCSGNKDEDEEVDRGVEALFSWDTIPVLDTAHYRQVSSHDRLRSPEYPPLDPGNKDFNNFIAVCGERPEQFLQETDGTDGCEPGMEGFLIAMDDHGPGFVSRMWLAALAVLTGDHFTDEVIRIYVDDHEVPVYEGGLADWVAGSGQPPFRPPLVEMCSGSLVSYVPISYSSSLRILLDQLHETTVYYYHVDLRSSGRTLPFETESFDEPLMSSIEAMLGGGAREADGMEAAVDESMTLPADEETNVLDHAGSGTIRRLEFVFDDVTEQDLRRILLRVRWDDLPEPAVSMSLAAFFGCHLALSSFDTLPLKVKREGTGVTLAFFLPMPFDSHASINLHNTGSGSLPVHVRVDMVPETPDGEWAHLGASFHSETEPPAGARYPVIDLAGRGKYVGTLMYLQGRADEEAFNTEAFNFLEGDELGVVDGEETIRGTGTEDYYNGAWYFEEGLHDYPFSALMHMDEDVSAMTGEVSVARWHILTDAIPFQESFRLDFEYGADRPVTAREYASVAFYYLR